MALRARHGNTKKYRLILILDVVNALAIGIVLTRLVPQEIAARVEKANAPLEQVESLRKKITSIEAQQQGTFDYLIQQAEETEIQFEELSTQVEELK